MKKKHRLYDPVKIKRVTWTVGPHGLYLADDVGPIISIKGETPGHRNIHKYAVHLTHSTVFTNNPLKP